MEFPHSENLSGGIKREGNVPDNPGQDYELTKILVKQCGSGGPCIDFITRDPSPYFVCKIARLEHWKRQPFTFELGKSC